jgi:hypothetical protein
VLDVGAANEYQWNTGDSTATITVTKTGTYAATATNQGGCAGTDSVSIDVQPLPQVSVSPDDTTICRNDSVELQASGGATYQWAPHHSLSDSNSAKTMAYADSSEEYVVTATDTNGCEATDTTNVKVDPLPAVPTITQHTDTLTTGQGYAGYQWFYNSAPLPDDTTYQHVAQQSGVYEVAVANQYGCTRMSDTANVALTGIAYEANARTIRVYPNPTNGKLIADINLEEPASPTMKVVDVLGRRITEIQTAENTASYTGVFDLSQKAPGVYYLVVEAKDKDWLKVEKVVVSH